MAVETFDFQRYINEHRDPNKSHRSLPVGEYAYRGDVRLLRTLHTLAPVRLMVTATLRLWKTWGKRKLLKGSSRVGEQDAPRIRDLAMSAARALHLTPQVLYLTPQLRGEVARALGMNGEFFVAVQPESARTLDDAALLFVLGRELGHIQNGHVIYHTAAYYGDELAGMVVKWATTPAVLSLNRWRQHSELTADRAGLLACKNLEAARQQIARQSLAERQLESDIDIDAVINGDIELDNPSYIKSFGERLPELRLRLAALEAFSKSRYYHDHLGDHPEEALTLSEVDAAVEEMISEGVRS